MILRPINSGFSFDRSPSPLFPSTTLGWETFRLMFNHFNSFRRLLLYLITFLYLLLIFSYINFFFLLVFYFFLKSHIPLFLITYTMRSYFCYFSLLLIYYCDSMKMQKHLCTLLIGNSRSKIMYICCIHYYMNMYVQKLEIFFCLVCLHINN